MTTSESEEGTAGPSLDPLSNVQKTPISLLQELCARHSLTPDYKLLSVEGAVHAPTFMYRVEVGETVATATGQSKKKAKHSAAKAILEKLLASDGIFANMSFSDGSTFSKENLSTAIPEPEVETDGMEDGIVGNPVGELQEFCMKRRWRPPYYETVVEKGLPHERTFVIACYVGRMDTIGTGKSKRLAKRQAGDSMMKMLKEKGEDLIADDVDPKHPSSMLDKEAVSPKKGDQTALGISNHSLLVQKFIEKIRETPDPRLLTAEITRSPNGESYVDTLVHISEDQGFDINFVPLKETGFTGKHYCLVQLGSIPLAVCFGSALCPIEAKENAAQNAILFLRVITRGKPAS